MSSVVSVVGNPRADSRTHGIARTLTAEIARVTGYDVAQEVDLALLGAKVLDWGDADAAEATDRVLASSIVVVASPTFKATYSGLTKCFLDRINGGALAGTPAIPVLLGGAPDHRLGVDVHFTPLLLELGASLPVRGLFVLESELDGFEEWARAWADEHAGALKCIPDQKDVELHADSRSS